MVGAFRIGRPPIPLDRLPRHPTNGTYWYAGRWRTQAGIEAHREWHREHDPRRKEAA